MQELAHAKINLSLRVLGRRPDGYHELESLVVFADAADRLLIEPSETLSLSLGGPFAGQLETEPDNLVLRAARALQEFADVTSGAAISLEKNLPLASGIGGGSADAAAALRVLCKIWRLQATRSELVRLGLKLGADVPVCLTSAPALMRGVGEKITSVEPLPSLPLLLVNPGVAVSTAEIFKLLQASPLKSEVDYAAPAPEFSSMEELILWLHENPNDLEKPAIALAPVIASVLHALRDAGCSFARMSGSGATCFGLFSDAATARLTASTLRHSHPDWWVSLSGCD